MLYNLFLLLIFFIFSPDMSAENKKTFLHPLTTQVPLAVITKYTQELPHDEEEVEGENEEHHESHDQEEENASDEYYDDEKKRKNKRALKKMLKLKKHKDTCSKKMF